MARSTLRRLGFALLWVALFVMLPFHTLAIAAPNMPSLNPERKPIRADFDVDLMELYQTEGGESIIEWMTDQGMPEETIEGIRPALEDPTLTPEMDAGTEQEAVNLTELYLTEGEEAVVKWLTARGMSPEMIEQVIQSLRQLTPEPLDDTSSLEVPVPCRVGISAVALFTMNFGVSHSSFGYIEGGQQSATWSFFPCRYSNCVMGHFVPAVAGREYNVYSLLGYRVVLIGIACQ